MTNDVKTYVFPAAICLYATLIYLFTIPSMS